MIFFDSSISKYDANSIANSLFVMSSSPLFVKMLILTSTILLQLFQFVKYYFKLFSRRETLILRREAKKWLLKVEIRGFSSIFGLLVLDFLTRKIRLTTQVV